MIYVCDFFAAKEAVSNQMEMLRAEHNSWIFSAVRFLGQKPLRIHDLLNRRVILPERIYNPLLYIIARTAKTGIHYFEEEPSGKIRFILNQAKCDLYISMYRKPDRIYAKHLLKYKKLKNVFVELPNHRDILLDFGVPGRVVKVYRTPSLFIPEENGKPYDPQNIKILYASWNNAEGDPLEERGINYLLDLVSSNKNLSLIVLPRDRKTSEFNKKVEALGISKRVDMKWIKSMEDLKNSFKECDFVAFTPKKKISKDVPNSIIDGLSLGKPCIISNVVDFNETVAKKQIGIVLPKHKIFSFKISINKYRIMSRNAFLYSLHNTKDNYTKIIDNYA